MQTFIENNGEKFVANINKPLDISIPLRSGKQNPNAFGLPLPEFKPFESGDFIASVAKGSPVNCENIFLNPHGNGTHTECAGHILRERVTINETLKSFFFFSQLLTVELIGEERNRRIAANHVIPKIREGAEALIIRTLPNGESKKTEWYSGNGPPFVEPEICKFLYANNIKHFLIDLPSVDPEKDEGKLEAHKAFWNVPENPGLDATITEMIFVPDHISDGLYLLNLQIASIESDASPSKPVLY